MKTYAAFSGGKDSTGMVFKMQEQGEEFDLLFTPTGDELPELLAHLQLISDRLGKEIIVPKGPSLDQLIREFQALPNHRQRWCTRMIKIVPCIAFLKSQPGSTLCVGLRADEETRVGLYGDFAKYRYPLRELNMRERGARLCGVARNQSSHKNRLCAVSLPKDRGVVSSLEV